jgi:hypothetical protein
VSNDLPRFQILKIHCIPLNYTRLKKKPYPRCILTDTPGAGKPTVPRLLEFPGHLVIEESATDGRRTQNHPRA